MACSIGKTKQNERVLQIACLPSVLIPWYEKNGRALPWRESPTPYHVWLSEVMLQQTRIDTVIPYYFRFIDDIPDIETLAETDSDKLQKLWEGLGYYSRVRNLQAAARQIMSDYNGKFPENYEDIRRLKGIGDYTAGAIASICFDSPVPAVDGNVLRVLARLTGDERPINDQRVIKSVREELASSYPDKKCGAYTQAIMELGETVCMPNGEPYCSQCPCRGFCFCKDGRWKNFPVKLPKKERRVEQLTVFILRCDDFVAVRKRGDSGLLSGMWEFPNVPGSLTDADVFEVLTDWGCIPENVESCYCDRHIFTHVEWNMKCFVIRCKERVPAFTWAGSADLSDSIALPTAFRKLLNKV